ncbi:SAVED domain-containing protein [Pleionea litopenaei]|uniref:SAVED domain-containing protein n=1 Tax=Pleionea litopenaei TaxID=3070815 RepID=A0AA51RUH4_9GAMM|nr:SAVED domain-containing protein [Pleionea sp. HL-JVS1]WMS87903.1 SAVED domain-containing protein [Pleionea sp. HL-JVS1]
MLKQLFKNFVLKGTDWLFRTRSIEVTLIKSALGVIITIYAGPPLIEIILRIFLDTLPSTFIVVRQTIDTVDSWILMICSIVILVALVLIVVRFLSERKSNTKKRVLVIESRGLRDDDGSPLDQIISNKFTGQVIPVLLDLRNRLDGSIVNPEQAIDDISATHRAVLQHQKHINRSDLTIVYGGLTSVPYTFLTGLMLDDEGTICTYDWDRTQEDWRYPDMEDDGLVFEVSETEEITNVEEVVIALAFSYPVNSEDLESTFSMPVVRLTLDGMSSDAHWSQDKQRRLAQQFLEIVKKLSAKGVKRIHLVMAAPNSVVFTFGRRYDKRNLPEIVVYQYERNKRPSYPWGILMPVAGVERARVQYS